MRTKVYKKGLIIGVIFLLIGISMIPITSSMDIVKEKNNQNVVNTQKLENSDKSYMSDVWRTYLFGKISDLTIKGDNYSFYCVNLFVFMIERDHDGNLAFSYERDVRYNIYGYYGFGFRGILKPTFICGYFYM